MKKFKRIRNILCPTCKTGEESYKLDALSPVCPYLSAYNGIRCPYYIPIEKEPCLFNKLVNSLLKRK